MRFGTVQDRLVLIQDGLAIDVEKVSGGAFSADVLDTLGRWDEFRAWAAETDFSAYAPIDFALAEGLGPPVPRPRQIFAVALNYRPHAAEAGYQVPDAPLIFTKFPSCITGPDVEVRLPAGRVDWEIEVVVVIGRGGTSIPHDKAWHAVAGLTVGQDLSERVLQLAGRPAQFSLGKSYPGFGPTGPMVVTADEFPNPDDIGFSATLNAEVVQDARTSDMIFPVDDLVARLSAVCELYPGDLIFTGTPAGIGNRRTPPRYLAPGDTLVSEVEGIGRITQLFAR